MALLADVIRGKVEKYLASPNLTKESEHFRFDNERGQIMRIKEKEQEKDNYVEWQEIKKLVSNLPTEYLDILKKKSVEGRVEKRVLGNGCEFIVEAKYDGFPVEIYVVEHKTGMVKRAEYIAYNKQKNAVFVKSLLSGQTFTDPLAQF